MHLYTRSSIGIPRIAATSLAMVALACAEVPPEVMKKAKDGDAEAMNDAGTYLLL